MTKSISALRAVAAALLLAVLLGAITQAYAQDAPDDSGSADAAAAYVDVSCWPDDASGGTSCSFTPGPAGTVNWLTVPSALFCAPVIGTGAAEWAADGISQSIDGANGAITLTFDGVVSAG